MSRLRQTLALACVSLAPAIHADQSTSANYSTAISLDAGGQRATSNDYEQNIFVTPISGRAVATASDVMIIGFGSRLNTAPIAVDDVRSHPLDAPVIITPSSLFANDFDPDGDALSLITVDPQSAAGGSLTITGQNITYTPPKGLTTLDQFNYTVADSNGDTASATVTLAIAPSFSAMPLDSVAIVPQPDGKYLVRFRQNAGFLDYVIQFTNDLKNPNWQTLYDAHAGADGNVEILIDPNLTGQTFIRAVTF
jgi:hypothetical protein